MVKLLKKTLKFAITVFMTLLFFPALLLFGMGYLVLNRRRSGEKARFFWGVTPIKTYAYWSAAMQEAGYYSRTVMREVYHINKRQDFDLLLSDFVPFGRWMPAELSRMLGSYIGFFYALRHFDIFCTTFEGMFFEGSFLHRIEGHLLHLFGKKVIVIPYGGDAYMYGKVVMPSLQHVLLMSYPREGRRQPEIQRRVNYWSAQADFMFCGLMIDGFPRWDTLPLSPFSIDEKAWTPKTSYNQADGKNGSVVIAHAPNHRGFKGTEYVIRAVEELQQEGWRIDFRLIERMPNEEVKRILGETDILVEQIVAFGYALNGIEGMASGCVVCSNLSERPHRELFSRYSFLEECPIVSSTHETLKDNLRRLIQDPALRQARGEQSRAFVEKYHSTRAGIALFEGILSDLSAPGSAKMMHFYHPLHPDSWNNRSPKIIPVPLGNE